MKEYTKDIECATCEHVFDSCKKPKDGACVSYKERDNGRKEDAYKKDN